MPWAGGAGVGGTGEYELMWTHEACGSALNLLRGTPPPPKRSAPLYLNPHLPALSYPTPE